MKFLVYAANLHVGGGVQVATSVIEELSLMKTRPAGLTVWASSVVDANLRQLGFDPAAFAGYEVVDHRGLSTLWSGAAARMAGYDCVLVIFGPLYVVRRTVPSVVGFAQPWIIYPDNEIHGRLPMLRRWLTCLKFRIQGVFFRRADVLLAELEHVRKGLVRQGIAEPDRIRVVHNCLSSIYLQPERWQSVTVPQRRGRFRLGFVGRNYPHKNTVIFPEVRAVLLRKHGLEVDLYVTFTDDEWFACAPEFRQAAENVGPLSVPQCPNFYRAMDGVLFPSLLECFSATPLEAMAMERPLFASDRPFIRDVCTEHAHYFDPMDPEAAADCIARYLKSDRDGARLAAARERALAYADAAGRARQYLECLEEAVLHKRQYEVFKDV
jgi:glycosyltransferase involved in cell wall biosynthesis